MVLALDTFHWYLDLVKYYSSSKNAVHPPGVSIINESRLDYDEKGGKVISYLCIELSIQPRFKFYAGHSQQFDVVIEQAAGLTLSPSLMGCVGIYEGRGSPTSPYHLN